MLLENSLKKTQQHTTRSNMLVTVITGPSEKQVCSAIDKTREFADVFEFRLDFFEKRSLLFVREMMEYANKPVIFTLRRGVDGGNFTGSETERKALLSELLELSPAYVDLELDMEKSFVEEVSVKFQRTQIICSYHDFHKSTNLESIFTQMLATPGVIFKLATTAKSTLDALRMMTFVQEKSKEHQMIGLCMGEIGTITRILGPIFGNTMDFSIPSPTDEVVPGQLSTETLCVNYRYKELTKSTQIYGLIGDPVEQSPSHITHNEVFRALHIDAVYVKMRVFPDELDSFFKMITPLGFKGLSVTIPLKEDVAEYLSEASEDVRQIGAVNTLLLNEGKILGDNTDAAAALDSLGPVDGKRVLILGAGGAARAITCETQKRGGKVMIVNRTEERAKELASDFSCESYSYTVLEEVCAEIGYDVLINTTSVGMAPRENELPIDPAFILPESIVMDIITTPKDTRLILEAKKKGCKAIYGKEMFFLQAARQFEIWFGQKASSETVIKLLRTN